MSDDYGPGRGWVPVPDPTKLTVEAQEKAVEQARRDLQAAMALVTTRLDRIRTDLDSIERHHDDSLKHWMRYVEQKFRGVDQRFNERSRRGRNSETAAKEALAQAFSAAKELSALTADHFKAEIEALKSQAGERAKSVDQQLAALNKSIDQGVPVGFVAGERSQKQETRAVGNYWLAVMGGVISVLVLVIAVLGYVAAHHG